MSLFGWLVKSILGRSTTKSAREFFEAARNPQRVQQELLLEKIRREASTGFGKDHHFSEIKSLADFRRNVPISDYDYFEPYIERVKNGESQALFSDEQVVMFALTSGTTSSQKFIPVTQRYVNAYRRGWMLWGAGAFTDHAHLFPKQKLVLTSDCDEFRTGSGIPCGSVSGLTAQMQNPLIRRSYVMPPESAKVHDAEAKYYLAWRLGVMQDIGSWISPNPSTHLNLARFGSARAESLIREIHSGTMSEDFEIPEAVRKASRRYLKPNSKRAAELESILSSTGALKPKDVWPSLGLIGCWLGGSLGAYVRNFPEYFGDVAVRDIGLISSESRMTIPKADGTAAGCLDITVAFFEFIPVGEIDSDQPTVLECHELEEGQDYYILLTTNSGLYRYNIFDVVRCTGWVEKTPMLEFLHKGSHISNVTGEKLSEHQVVQSVESVLEKTGSRLNTYSLAPCWDEQAPYYGLFIEQSDVGSESEELARQIDQAMRAANLEYEAKRDSQRLGPVRIEKLPDGWWAQWDRERLQKSGGTVEQYKHPALIPHLEFRDSTPAGDVGVTG